MKHRVLEVHSALGKPMVGVRKNVSSSLLFLTPKKWLCVLIPWEAEPHFPTTEWASLLHVFVGVSRGTSWVGDGFGVWLPSPTSCCEDWCFTWNHSSNTTKIYWTPRNNIRFPNLTHSCLLPTNQEFTIHQHNHPHKQLWINSSVSRETLAFS